MPTRRVALGAIGALAATLAGGSAAAPRTRRFVGVQLWSVLPELTADFDRTAQRLHALGFERVEAAGWLGQAPAAFGKRLRAAGLRCDSAHIAMPDLRRDMRGAVAAARDAGCGLLVCSSPQAPVVLDPALGWMAGLAHAMTRDAWHRNADWLNEAGRIAHGAGLRLGYHNHTAEFVRLGTDAVHGYDVLLSATDPGLVHFELDVAWAAAGGADPVDLLGRIGPRVIRLHLKDLARQPTPGRPAHDIATVPVGSGVLPWLRILRAADEAHVASAYLEVEPPHTRSPFDQLAEGISYLRHLSAHQNG